MYHERTFTEIARRRRKQALAAVIVVVLVIVILLVVNAAQASMREQSELSVRNAIVDAAKQCCAVEGSYPSSIEHLEEHYGLTINRNDYVISYEWLADNIPPSVVVTAR